MLTNDPIFFKKAVLAVFLSWLISQLIKVARGVAKEHRFNFRWLFDTGGMPSSHSATVSSLSTITCLHYGSDSIIFLIVVIFTMITMFDAAGVRRNVGRQAVILNSMLDDMYEKGEVGNQRVRELLGHTPVQVFAGAGLGIIIALIICR